EITGVVEHLEHLERRGAGAAELLVGVTPAVDFHHDGISCEARHPLGVHQYETDDDKAKNDDHEAGIFADMLDHEMGGDPWTGASKEGESAAGNGRIAGLGTGKTGLFADG